MAFVTLNSTKLKHNFTFLNTLFQNNSIEWGVVTKLLCGNKLYIQELLNLGVQEIHDSRVSNLRAAKQLDPNITTCYIKPPAKRSIKSIVTYADVSLNTELATIKLLSAEAQKQNKTHKIIIMIELGDLREGVLGEQLLDFYEQVFNLPNIDVIGLGANLNCLSGVMPSTDKMIQLCLYEQLIEAKFNRRIPFVSGGTSVVIPLLLTKQVPKGINHFRVGEMLYFGNNLFTGEPMEGMESDVIKLYAEIIELSTKPVVPIGQLEANPSGEVFEIDPNDYGKTALRGILDLGLLDISTEFLIPCDKGISISGASSDMLIVDFENADKDYQVGDLVEFNLKYMGALGLLNSNYIEKRVTE